MNKTQNEVVNKILELINANSYSSEFKSNKLKYNNETYNLPIINNVLNTRNNRLR